MEQWKDLEKKRKYPYLNFSDLVLIFPAQNLEFHGLKIRNYKDGRK